MAKLAPPIVAGTLPAFYASGENGSITIPFAMNRAVSAAQIQAISIKIKTVVSTTYLGDIQTTNYSTTGVVQAIFTNLSGFDFTPGQYYKIQLAYVDVSGNVGYYSAVSTIKCTSKPVVSIVGLETQKTNAHLYQYTGLYSQENGDTTEKAYIYKFTVYDSDGEEIVTSGECLHNSQNDENYYSSQDNFECNYDLIDGETYKIVYEVTTTNQLNISSSEYKISQKLSVDTNIEQEKRTATRYYPYIVLTLNKDNGYVQINFHSQNYTGAFVLSRAEVDTNIDLDDQLLEWNKIMNFYLNNQQLNAYSYKDFTVEHGKTYIYSLQQYNDNGLYSNRLKSDTIYIEFEDAFLYDGERQLKIRFNPKIATFKKDVLETKVETIGSKYPFIFRNGQVDYKEFSIAGLISYYMDEEELFMTNSDLGLADNDDERTKSSSKGLSADNIRTRDLLDYNLAAERIFKLEVLDWLNNGKNKLFRSPTEGNYLVRLMNISLAPEDTVGRMLHSFTASAYEIGDTSYDGLSSLGALEVSDTLNIINNQIKTVTFSDINLENITSEEQWITLNSYPMKSLNLDNLIPGTIIRVTNEDGSNVELMIGVTGSYHSNTPVLSVEIPVSISNLANYSSLQLLYTYDETQDIVFDEQKDVEIIEIPLEQFVAEDYYSEENEYVTSASSNSSNILLTEDQLKVATNIDATYTEKNNNVSTYVLLPQQEIEYKNNQTEDTMFDVLQRIIKVSYKKDWVEPVDETEQWYPNSKFTLTKIYKIKCYLNKSELDITGSGINPYGPNCIENMVYIKQNDTIDSDGTVTEHELQKIDLYKINSIVFKNISTTQFSKIVDALSVLKVGRNVIVEISYQYRNIIYNSETQTAILKASSEYEDAKNQYQNALSLSRENYEIKASELKIAQGREDYIKYMYEQQQKAYYQYIKTIAEDKWKDTRSFAYPNGT